MPRYELVAYEEDVSHRRNARATSFACSVACRDDMPDAVEAERGRDTTPTTCLISCGIIVVMWLHAPWLSGSS